MATWTNTDDVVLFSSPSINLMVWQVSLPQSSLTLSRLSIRRQMFVNWKKTKQNKTKHEKRSNRTQQINTHKLATFFFHSIVFDSFPDRTLCIKVTRRLGPCWINRRGHTCRHYALYYLVFCLRSLWHCQNWTPSLWGRNRVIFSPWCHRNLFFSS